MKIKRIKSLGLLPVLFCTGQLFAQSNNATEADLQRFFNTKTLVVLDDSPFSEYNFYIREVVEKEWTLTEYEFIPFKEFEEKRKDSRYSFLKASDVTFEKDKLMARYKFLMLSMGGNYRHVRQMPDIAGVPIGYSSVEPEEYMYKVTSLVRFLHNHVLLLKEKPKLLDDRNLNYYNDNLEEIQDKTLYLLKEEMSPEFDTRREIEEVYPHKFKFVTREDIKKAIEQKDPDVVYLHKVGPQSTRVKARCYKIIIGAADAKFYYFDYHMIKAGKRPDGLLKSDFKKMAR